MSFPGNHLSRWMCIFVMGLLVLGRTNQALPQAQTGAVTGSVTDPSGAVLRGAQVSVNSLLLPPEVESRLPKDFNLVSDEQGLFFINGLVPGTYTLTINYVGFATLTQTVDVTAGQTTRVDAALQLSSVTQDVVVTAPRVGAEAEAINVERAADNVVQVLPSEVIRSLPNANMADALGRLPSITLERDEGEGKYVQVRGTEPRLTNTTIDGINLPSPEPGVRQIKFDAIPADSVESVQVNKTLQANMDGDGIGGSVNLITKVATNLPAFTFSSMGGYTPIINGRGLTEETATVGQRFGASKRFGILGGFSYDWNGRGIDDVEPVPDVAILPNGTTKRWVDGMDFRQYQYFRSRWGVNGSTDYRVGAGSDVYFRWFYSDFKNYGDRWAYSLTDNTPGVKLLAPGNSGCGTDDSGTTIGPCTGPTTFNAQRRNPDINIGSLVLGGRHVLTTSWASWDLSAARSSYGGQPYSTAVYNSTLDTSGCQYDPNATTNPYLPQWSAACYTEGYNPSNLTLNNINRSLGLSAQMNLSATGSVGKRYQLGSRSATIEFGGKFRNEHKFSESYVLRLTPKGTVPVTAFPSRLTNNHYYNGGQYKLGGYNPTEEDALAYATANPGAFNSTSTAGQDPAEYDLIEKVSAGYVMNTVDLSSRVRVVAGLRVEGTSDDVRNFSIGKSCATTSCITRNSFSGSYVTVLPSVSLRYGIGSDTDLRLVYARGLSRPDPQNLTQALEWSISANGANRYAVSLGNANLKAETGDDFDVLLDHYLKPFGEISVGYFYKYLQNPIVTHTFDLNNYQPPGGPLGNYLATQPVNAGNAWISGFEATYLQHFSSLPGALLGLGLSANYGYAASRTTGIPGRTDHPRLLRMSPNAFNISPTYDFGRLSVRLGMSYNQASIYSYQYADGTPGGVTGPLSDIYFYMHFQTDVQGSLRLSHG
jgi:TonB-dependent receptor